MRVDPPEYDERELLTDLATGMSYDDIREVYEEKSQANGYIQSIIIYNGVQHIVVQRYGMAG